ncbi:MAG: T9SS type A sorting domain-containing protein [Bacteroidetes bacterium]|nr:T9SS type A sorting domain-containing protein [Bacteroidota bacterium]HET6243943.1 T9SS type A sorting domain-containing protein [Bacteroidia bacterium]
MKSKIFVKLLILFLIANATDVIAQQQPYGNWGCYDSLLVSPGTYCYPEYDPVCACNDTTYRNNCFARIAGFQQYVSGICEAVDFNIDVNPVYYALDLDIILKQEGPVTVYVFDWFGKVYYQDYFTNVKRMDLYIDAGSFKQGMYLVAVKNYEEQVIKKFVKIDR